MDCFIYILLLGVFCSFIQVMNNQMMPKVDEKSLSKDADHFYKCVSKYKLSRDERLKNGLPIPGVEIRSKKDSNFTSYRSWFKCYRCVREFKRFKAMWYQSWRRRSKYSRLKYRPNFYQVPRSDIRRCYVHCDKIRSLRHEFRNTGFRSTTEDVCHLDWNVNLRWNKRFKLRHYRIKKGGNVFSIDCEMCVTAMGMELTRVSVVDRDLNIVYDTLVRPQTRIIDDCRRISGISLKSLLQCRTTFEEVQHDLLLIFNKDTILIGHDLANDLRVLKLYHENVVDTSVVYPFTREEDSEKVVHGRKHSLQTLAKVLLNKVIHTKRNGSKHDAGEDARTCMELIKMKCRL